jgi:hypothetical protein
VAEQAREKLTVGQAAVCLVRLINNSILTPFTRAPLIFMVGAGARQMNKRDLRLAPISMGVQQIKTTHTSVGPAPL